MAPDALRTDEKSRVGRAVTLGNYVALARRVVRNAIIDLRFGPPLAAAYLRDRSQSNSDYADLELLFEGRVDRRDVCVDVGCGAGRVINQWLRMGIDGRIYGLEHDRVLASATRRRFRRRSNVAILAGDAAANLPPDGTFFFLFNPFDESTTRRFARSISELARHVDRELSIVYLNCKHVSVFLDDPRFRVRTGRLERGSSSGQSFATIAVLAREQAWERIVR